VLLVWVAVRLAQPRTEQPTLIFLHTQQQTTGQIATPLHLVCARPCVCARPTLSRASALQYLPALAAPHTCLRARLAMPIKCGSVVCCCGHWSTLLITLLLPCFCVCYTLCVWVVSRWVRGAHACSCSSVCNCIVRFALCVSSTVVAILPPVGVRCASGGDQTEQRRTCVAPLNKQKCMKEILWRVLARATLAHAPPCYERARAPAAFFFQSLSRG
jgi:hypothetical protein